MIKRIRFATRRETVRPETVLTAWRQGAARAAQAPPGARPLRVAVCTALDDARFGPARHDVVGIEWFADTRSLAGHQAWLDTPEGRDSRGPVDRVTPTRTTLTVVAHEQIRRGADWLDARWRDGGVIFKHVAVARRASGLTPAEFSRRWAAHAGRVQVAGQASATVIPDRVRGNAYVQNHPCPRPEGGEWPYDAVNEVYFADPDGLAQRAAWFRENPPDDRGDLFGRSEFFAVREELLPPC